MATLAAYALVIRLVIDLATPWLPGAYVLHADGLAGVTAAHGAPSPPTAMRPGVPAEGVESAAPAVVPSPPAVVATAGPMRRVPHPLRLPAKARPSDPSADH